VAPVSHTDRVSTDQLRPHPGIMPIAGQWLWQSTYARTEEKLCSRLLFVVRALALRVHSHLAARAGIGYQDGLRSQPVRSARERKPARHISVVGGQWLPLAYSSDF